MTEKATTDEFVFEAEMDNVRQKTIAFKADAKREIERLSEKSENLIKSFAEHGQNIYQYMQKEDRWFTDCKLLDSINDHAKRIEDFKANMVWENVNNIPESDIRVSYEHDNQHAARDCLQTWVCVEDDIKDQKQLMERIRDEYTTILNKRQKNFEEYKEFIAFCNEIQRDFRCYGAFYDSLWNNEQRLKEQCKHVDSLFKFVLSDVL